MEGVGLTSQEKRMDLFDYHQNVLAELTPRSSSRASSVELDLNQTPIDIDEDFLRQLVREEEEEFKLLLERGFAPSPNPPSKTQPYFEITPPNRLHVSPITKTPEKKRPIGSALVDEPESAPKQTSNQNASNPKQSKTSKMSKNRDDLLGFQKKKPAWPRAPHLLATSVVPLASSNSDSTSPLPNQKAISPRTPNSSERDRSAPHPVTSKPAPSPSKTTRSNSTDLNHDRAAHDGLSSDTEEEEEMAKNLTDLAGNESEGEVIEISATSRPVQVEDKLKNRTLPGWMIDPQYIEMKVRVNFNLKFQLENDLIVKFSQLKIVGTLSSYTIVNYVLFKLNSS